ncbi:hypothetical protein LCGC14_1101820 [marine sediment metagenome]|uniref:Uncharacterized protein n=1 Tax=marine sediment metagenome TaxID=412755 RepID=A0A0F9MDT2_9ZZZZ
MSKPGDENHAMPEGGMIRTSVDGSWSWCQPNGTYLRGRATSQDVALSAAEKARGMWILSQWAKGSAGRGAGVWCCPLD